MRVWVWRVCQYLCLCVCVSVSVFFSVSVSLCLCVSVSNTFTFAGGAVWGGVHVGGGGFDLPAYKVSSISKTSVSITGAGVVAVEGDPPSVAAAMMNARRGAEVVTGRRRARARTPPHNGMRGRINCACRRRIAI